MNDAVELAERFPTHLSPSDAVMWNIEKDPVLRSTITAIAVLDSTPDWERLVQVVERASRVIPRLRQRVVVPPLRLGPARWVDDRTFDLDYHLRRVRVAEPGDFRAALDAAQPMGSAAFDRARPLWEFTLIDGLDDGHAVFVQKLHHSMADGLGVVELAMELLDDQPDAAPRPMPDQPPQDVSGAGADGIDALAWWARTAMRAPLAVGSAAWGAARRPLRTAIRSGRTIRSIGRITAPLPPSASPLLVERSLRRRFHTIDIDLAALKDAGRAAGASLNDAFLAATVEGIRRYHRHHGIDLDHVHLTMPVSLRHEDDSLGTNHFAPARFAVPSDIDDPVVRMQRIGSIARGWRDEAALPMSDGIAFALERVPVSLSTAFFGAILKHVDAVVTNVPGLPVRAYLAGSEVLREYAFAPPAGAALNVSLVSHLDLACIGVVVDSAAVPDDQVLVECLADGLEDVLSVAD